MDQVPSPGKHHNKSNKVHLLHRLGMHIAAYLIRFLVRTRSSFQEVNRDLHNQMLLKSLRKTILLCYPDQDCRWRITWCLL